MQPNANRAARPTALTIGMREEPLVRAADHRECLVDKVIVRMAINSPLSLSRMTPRGQVGGSGCCGAWQRALSGGACRPPSGPGCARSDQRVLQRRWSRVLAIRPRAAARRQSQVLVLRDEQHSHNQTENPSHRLAAKTTRRCPDRRQKQKTPQDRPNRQYLRGVLKRERRDSNPRPPA